MTRKLKEFIKKHRLIYSIYYYVVSFFVNTLKLFLKTDDKLILFVSYGGRHYSDSPRVIYEAMLRDSRFDGYRKVWAFVNPERFDVSDKIKIDTFTYFKTALKARCWVTNVMIERALNFRGIHTYYFCTWHGSPIKYDGCDSKKLKFFSKASSQYDCYLTQSEYAKRVASRIFGLKEGVAQITGIPKNDILSSYTDSYRAALREKLNIPPNKKAILYAPTFREGLGLRENFQMHVEKWRNKLAEEYVLLYRAHPSIAAEWKANDAFFHDVTFYEVGEDLMIASDLLLSDYSSIMFDYSIMRKPIYLWTYDYDEYQEKRGLYLDPREELPFSGNEDELIDMIACHDWSRVPEGIAKFREKYATVCGHATETSLNLIWEHIQ